MSLLGSSLKFTGKVFGGGYLRDALNPRADNSGAKQLAETLRILREADSRQQIGTQKSVEQQRRILPLLTKAYDTARSATALAGTPARQQVLDREQQTLGMVTGQYAGGNMFNSSLHDNAVRSVRGDTDASLNTINAAIGERMAQLSVGEAGAKAGVMSGIGDTFQQGAAASAAILGQQANTVASVVHKKKKDIFDLLGSVAPIIGGLAAGPPGALAASALTTAAAPAPQGPAFNPNPNPYLQGGSYVA